MNQLVLRDYNKLVLGNELTPEEEVILITKSQEGDTYALECLLRYHLRDIKIAASYMKRYRFSTEDLYQEGMVGLLRAIYGFKRDFGVRLRTYAFPWIKAAMYTYIADNWNIVRSCTTKERRKSFFQNTQDFAIHKGDYSLDHIPEHSVISSPLQEHDIELKERLVILHKAIMFLFLSINDRSKDIFIHRHLKLEPSSFKSLGRKYNVSSERIRQIDNMTISLLKNLIREQT